MESSSIVTHAGLETAARQNTPRMEGVVSLLLTPFTTSGEIDWDAYDRYLDWQLSFNPSGLFAVCGSSEMAWLTLDERLELASRAVARAGNIPVVATANLEVDRDAHAEEIDRMISTGISGFVLIPRAELTTDPSAYADYLLQLIERADAPAYLYEWPQVDNYLLADDVFAKVAPHIAGVKDTTCTIGGITTKLQKAEGAIVYQANTPYLLESVELGARGYMAITSTCAADLAVETWKALEASNEESASKLHRELVFLDTLLVRSYPAIAKAIVARRGVPIETTCRWKGVYQSEFDRAIEAWLTLHNHSR